MTKAVVMKRITIMGDSTVHIGSWKKCRILGATGHTSYPVHGKGQRGIRPRHAEPSNAKSKSSVRRWPTGFSNTSLRTISNITRCLPT